MKRVSCCASTLESVLKDKGSPDIFSRLWPRISETIKARHRNAMDELEKILNDTRSYVINYNHYYTDTIKKRQAERRKHQLSGCLEKVTQHKTLPECQSDHTFPSIDVNHVLGLFAGHIILIWITIAASSQFIRYDLVPKLWIKGSPKVGMLGLSETIYCKRYHTGRWMTYHSRPWTCFLPIGCCKTSWYWDSCSCVRTSGW